MHDLTPISALDVAEYILAKGQITGLKLQKLVYYSQAWNLVWNEAPLFHERIEAWRNGPVVPELYSRHAKQLSVATVGGNRDALSEPQRRTADAVLVLYGTRTSEWLRELTHLEKPWIDAWGDRTAEASGSDEITLQAMAEFYEGQTPGGPCAEIDLESVDLERLIEAEAEIRRGEFVEWDALKRELHDQARSVGRSADQGMP